MDRIYKLKRGDVVHWETESRTTLAGRVDGETRWSLLKPCASGAYASIMRGVVVDGALVVAP